MDFRIIDFGFSRCYGDYKRHGICKQMDEKLKEINAIQGKINNKGMCLKF